MPHYHKGNLSSKPSKVDTSHDSFYKVNKVMQAGDAYDEGKLKGASIGVAPHNPVNGGDSQPVKISSDYAEHLKSEWKKARGYEK